MSRRDIEGQQPHLRVIGTVTVQESQLNSLVMVHLHIAGKVRFSAGVEGIQIPERT
ncbi:MAG: hypothetical protein ABWY57_17385 [Mycetocola sp.]